MSNFKKYFRMKRCAEMPLCLPWLQRLIGSVSLSTFHNRGSNLFDYFYYSSQNTYCDVKGAFLNASETAEQFEMLTQNTL